MGNFLNKQSTGLVRGDHGDLGYVSGFLWEAEEMTKSLRVQGKGLGRTDSECQGSVTKCHAGVLLSIPPLALLVPQ